MSPPPESLTDDEQPTVQSPNEIYSLSLYVSGASRHSFQAITNLRGICEQYLSGRYTLEVIDLYQQPELAAAEQLIVAPTLIKRYPPPMRRLIGTLANVSDVVRHLGISTE